jgi:acetyltransferase-like isoleucine patch superfamily enzyme
MASLNYLWKNRSKQTLLSLGFFKAWAKRVITLPELIRRFYARKKIELLGASVASSCEIGEIIADGQKRNLSIGSNSFLGRVQLALHDKITIGQNVCINDGVILLTASHDVRDPEWKHKKSPIVIEDYVWIATNAIILPGVTVGKGAVVGAGSVVSRNVNEYEIVGGNPARVIAKDRTKLFNYNPCEFLAANQAWIKG